MPNYVSHLVKVVGQTSNVEQFKSAIRKKDAPIFDESAVIDFNRFIKMPEALIDSYSPSVTERVEQAKENGDFSMEQASVWLGEDMKGAALEAALSKEKELRDKHGYDNWYNWSVANWGVKWNAVEPVIVSEDEKNGITTFVFHFQTAWSMPEGIIKSMVGMCKSMKVSIEIKSEEEGGYFDCLTTITPSHYEVNIGEPFYWMEDSEGKVFRIDNLEEEQIAALGLDPDDVTGEQRGFWCDNTGDLFIDFKRSKKQVYESEKA